MIRDKIQKSKRVDKKFKMNFLMLVYNFFIKAIRIGLSHVDYSVLEGMLMNALGITGVSCWLIS